MAAVDDLVVVAGIQLCMTTDEDGDEVLAISIPFSATDLDQDTLGELIKVLQDFDDNWGF